MIQVVTYSGEETKYNAVGVEQYSLHDIRSLDEYEINVIDLNDWRIWCTEGSNYTTIDEINDFISISEMISSSKLSKVVILLPQNYNFRYYLWNSKYREEIELKNMLDGLTSNILSKLYVYFRYITLSYENTKTKIGSNVYEAAFCFKNISDANILLKSEKGKKPTVCDYEGVVISALRIDGIQELFELINELGFLEQKENVPEWMNEIKMFDDLIQEEKIDNCNDRINILQQEIDEAEKVLEGNMRTKSVLYTTGTQLVNSVFEIFEEMLGCDLSDFVDVNEEDMRFQIDNTTFIGEIKGVNHNVKNENISQLDIHYQRYWIGMRRYVRGM